MISGRDIRESKRLAQVDLAEEGRGVWREFQRAAGEVALFEQLRDTRYYRSLEGGREGRNLYTYFPFLFAEAFPGVTSEQLRRVSLMALLYLHHILIDDEWVDEGGDDPELALLVSRGLCLKALQVLDELVGERPLPWERILEFHQSYALALRGERERHFDKPAPYSREELREVLSAKASMAKLVPLALGALCDDQRTARRLERSLDFFYLADQMFDDFRDWKDDLEQGHYSYLLTKVILSHGLEEALQDRSARQARDLVGKTFYLSGMAEDYFREMLGYVEEAKRAARGLDCPRWRRFLNGVVARACAYRCQVFYRVRRTLMSSTGGVQAGGPPGAQADSPGPASASSIAESARRASAFLGQGFDAREGMPDFLVFDRPLPIRVAAFAASALARWHAAHGGSEASGEREFAEALRRFLSNRGGEGGWPARPGAPADAATTAWAVEALLACPESDRRALEHGLSSLQSFRTGEGLYATFRPSSPIREMRCWCAGHPEVTGQVLGTLLQAEHKPSGRELRESVERLLAHAGPDGLWRAYWWDGGMLATFYCLDALNRCGTLPDTLARKVARSVRELQREDGGFRGEAFPAPSAFQTAFAIRTLLLLDPSCAHRATARRALDWLLRYQSRDGGWEPQPVFRLPGGHCSKPWEQEDWRIDATYGTDALVRDQNRYFTTSSALLALADFRSACHNRRRGRKASLALSRE